MHSARKRSRPPVRPRPSSAAGRLFPWAVSAAVLLLSACSQGSDTGASKDTTDGSDSGGAGSGDDGPVECGDLTPSIEVGTGEDGFEPIEEGAPITMVHGPQGGWHMLGSVQTSHLGQIVEVHFTVEHLASGVVIADNTYRVATIYDEAACSGVYPGMYGYLSVGDLEDGELDTPPELLSYESVEFCMEATDQQGHSAQDCLVVTAVPDPMDVEDPGAGDGDDG